MPKIEYIIVHCSDSDWGTASEIRKWHLANGWRDIGYQLVILNGLLKPDIKNVQKKLYIESMDGSIEYGRDFDGDGYLVGNEIGAHAVGYNGNSISICLIGKTRFTLKQINSLENVLKNLMKTFNIKRENILGHCDVQKGKTCPNFNVKNFVRDRIK